MHLAFQRGQRREVPADTGPLACTVTSSSSPFPGGGRAALGLLHRGHWTQYVSTNVSGIWERGAHSACSFQRPYQLLMRPCLGSQTGSFLQAGPEPAVEPEEGDKPPRRFFRSLAYLSHRVARAHFPRSPCTDRAAAPG